MAVGYGGLITIKDEADCTDCYLNKGRANRGCAREKRSRNKQSASGQKTRTF